MSLVVPHVGEIQMLKDILNVAGNVLKLFSNNYTPVGATTLANLTEVSGGGYAAVTLTAGNWNFTSGTPSFGLYSVFVNFAFTGTPLVPTAYGYFIVDAGGNLLIAEAFTVVNLANGVTIPIKPKLTLQSIQQ